APQAGWARAAGAPHALSPFERTSLYVCAVTSVAGQALRRRIVLAVIFLAAFIVLLRLAVLAGEFGTGITATLFEAARADRTAPPAFLPRMPAGGAPHTPPRAAPSAERFHA